MTSTDLLLGVLAVGVAMLLARGSHPVAAALLIASALAISAVLFLPTRWLIGWIGIDRMHDLYSAARSTPLEPPEWVHLVAFLWLGCLLWLVRKELRNWRGPTAIAALGIAAEVSQVLTDGRTPKLEDAGINVLGGLIGMLLGMVVGVLAAVASRGFAGLLSHFRLRGEGRGRLG